MKKKFLSVLLVGAMTASVVAGCGDSSQGTTSNAAGEEKRKPRLQRKKVRRRQRQQTLRTNPITLKTVSMFGGTDPNKETYEAINEDFTTEYGYVTIEDNSQTSDEEWKASINADFSVGNEPDVIQFFTDATADSIVATDKLVSIDEIRAEYPEYAKDTLDSALEAAKNTDGVERACPYPPWDTGKAYTATRIYLMSITWNSRLTGSR